MAEATYTFGFHGVTAGRWLLERLRREYGMSGDYFDFGRDLTYALDPSIPARQRNGVCFYSRPGTPRRAYELAVLALGLFAKRHPDVEIHVYGTEAKRLPFAVTNHGLQTPEQLNELYNRCVAGLVLSATNVSLVPHEMLAAGCIPVVNDAEHNRIVLDNAHVAYSSPFELATTLSRLVERPPAERIAAATGRCRERSVDFLGRRRQQGCPHHRRAPSPTRCSHRSATEMGEVAPRRQAECVYRVPSTPKRRPAVTALIPTYNYGRFLRECTHSVLSQRDVDVKGNHCRRRIHR